MPYNSGFTALGPIAYADGTVLAPGSAFSSEISLGFYRSAASTIAMSYGTLTLPGKLDGATASLTGTLTHGTNTVGAPVVHNGPANASGGKDIYWQTAGVLRWVVRTDAGAESGGDAGSAWQLLARTDAGGAIDTPISVARAAGADISIGRSITISTGTLTLLDGNMVASGRIWGSSLSVSGGLNVKAGANKSCGTAVLGSNGSVNVANTYVATGDLIFLTDQTPGGTLGDLEMTGIRNGSGFTIASTSVTDTSTVAWLIVRPT